MRTPAEIATAFSPRDELRGHSSFYLVGIGGAGMSGIAKMLQRRGFAVRGSDSTPSALTAELEANGIPVRIGHSGEGVRGEDAIVLSDAIDLGSSPEVAQARELGCKLFRRSQVLGWLLMGKKVIAVTGTHGKTTTTGMIGAGLRTAGMDPTIVVGAGVPEFGGSVVEGAGEWAVVEACEAYDSFHDIDPTIVVLTNLEPDHLDYHGSFAALKSSVKSFIAKLDDTPYGGKLIYCADDEGAAEIGNESMDEKVCFEADFYTLHDSPTHPPFAIPKLAMPGNRNALNAQGALRAALAAGADLQLATEGIASFGGAERRLQVLLDGMFSVVDDYAHHPTEIQAGIEAIRERFGSRRLIVVFQPHLYSRTALFFPEFAKALSLADHVVLTDIYPAREEPMPGISSARIAELVTVPCAYIPSRHLLPRKVAAMVRKGDVVVGMGAGNISEFAPALLKELDRIGSPPPAPSPRTSHRGEGVLSPSPPAPSPPEGRGGSRRVAVIYGGDSAEREVSIHSGLAVQGALERKGYEANLYDVTEMLLSKGEVREFTGASRPDVAFLAEHGTHAEDGAIQGFFELLHIPYTGSGIQASAIAMDKRLTKHILEGQGIRVPRGVLLDRPDDPVLESLLARRRPEFGLSSGTPGSFGSLVVKPNAQGSTVGLSFVRREEELGPAIEKAFQYDSTVLVEEWIEGMEISVPVLGDRALPVVEIVPASGEYDYASKYLPGATEEIVPARLSEEVAKDAQNLALQCHATLCCEGATRTDMIAVISPPPTPSPSGDGEGVSRPEIYVLEINTLPGMTATSLLPNSAKADGVGFDELCDWMVQDALRRHGAKT